VKRLRTHTSVVYWVGGNEKSGDFFRKLVNYGDQMFDEMIPGICETLDPYRPSAQPQTGRPAPQCASGMFRHQLRTHTPAIPTQQTL